VDSLSRRTMIQWCVEGTMRLMKRKRRDRTICSGPG
jgi:hypothetical protein